MMDVRNCQRRRDRKDGEVHNGPICISQRKRMNSFVDMAMQGKPTQSEPAAQRETEQQQDDGNEELVVLSNGRDKRRASCRLPDLMQ
jgi:hypothetical protein